MNVSGRNDAAGPNEHPYGFLRKVSIYIIFNERRDKKVILNITLNQRPLRHIQSLSGYTMSSPSYDERRTRLLLFCSSSAAHGRSLY